MKLPEIVKRAAGAAGNEDFPARYAEAREWQEEIEGALDDALKEDARIRHEEAELGRSLEPRTAKDDGAAGKKPEGPAS